MRLRTKLQLTGDVRLQAEGLDFDAKGDLFIMGGRPHIPAASASPVTALSARQTPCTQSLAVAGRPGRANTR